MLSFQHLTKQFPGVLALDQVSWDAHPGSVHALCGENGAGKSTLLKILSGVYQPDEGGLAIHGKPVKFGGTGDALRAGVAVIYQELFLIPEMSVAENIWLGHMPSSGGFLNKRELINKTEESLRRVGLMVSPRQKVGRLSLAQRQMVEIAKALTHDAQIIAFDEPTSSLSAREVEQLFALIAELKATGKVILYVSHRMDEVKRICDACTVLRDGRHVETFTDLASVTPEMIINRMVGREISDVFGYSPRSHGDVVLEVEHLAGRGLREPVSFSVRAGEIVGLFGLVGAGRTEILKAVYDQGEGIVSLNGKAETTRNPRKSIDRGIVLIPEDRKHEGIVPVLSVSENLNLSVRRRFAKFGFLSRPRERANATTYVDKLRVKTATLETAIGTLSGGNQQKVILARWLSENVKVILLDEPTRGIDVGAKSEIYAIINDLARQGVAVVLVSSELPEVMGVSDRILVMCEGRLTGEVAREDASEARLLEMALPKGSELAA